MRTINSSTSPSIRGRPRVRRARDPSNLRATSLRYHAKMVSGRAACRHLAECLAAQSTANLAKLRSLCVRELQPPLQLAPQNPVFSSQIFVPQQQLLVHRPGDVGQDACPLHASPPICPPIREGALNRPKKPSGRHAARLRRDGITTRLSCSFNFLATRVAILVSRVLGSSKYLLAPADSHNIPKARQADGTKQPNDTC